MATKNYLFKIRFWSKVQNLKVVWSAFLQHVSPLMCCGFSGFVASDVYQPFVAFDVYQLFVAFDVYQSFVTFDVYRPFVPPTFVVWDFLLSVVLTFSDLPCQVFFATTYHSTVWVSLNSKVVFSKLVWLQWLNVSMFSMNQNKKLLEFE